MAGRKRARGSVNPFHEPVVLIEDERRHFAKHDALFAAVRGIDDRMAAVAALRDPEAIDGGLKTQLVVAGNLGLEPLGFLLKHRGDRIVDRGRDNADAERHEQRGRDELPGRHASRAGDHEFEPPRQAEIAGHRADQRAERQDALGDLRNAEQRGLGDLDGRDVRRIRQPTHHLDVVDQDDQREHAEQHRDQRGQELHAEIARERAGHRAAPAIAAIRCATHSWMRPLAVVRKAGGSMISPREIE